MFEPQFVIVLLHLHLCSHCSHTHNLSPTPNWWPSRPLIALNSCLETFEYSHRMLFIRASRSFALLPYHLQCLHCVLYVGDLMGQLLYFAMLAHAICPNRRPSFVVADSYVGRSLTRLVTMSLSHLYTVFAAHSVQGDTCTFHCAHKLHPLNNCQLAFALICRLV